MNTRKIERKRLTNTTGTLKRGQGEEGGDISPSFGSFFFPPGSHAGATLLGVVVVRSGDGNVGIGHYNEDSASAAYPGRVGRQICISALWIDLLQHHGASLHDL